VGDKKGLMKIIYNKKDGSINLKFSLREIMRMVFKGGLFLNKYDLRSFHGYTAEAVIKNIQNNQYNDQEQK
jgi:ribosomal protein L25 (general stress protein Ctc)